MVQEYATKYYLPALRGDASEDDPPHMDAPTFVRQDALTG
jgi:hypothetical protein